MRPIYLEAKKIAAMPETGNSGLWYDKFCDEWQSDWQGLGKTGKKDWIDETAGRNAGNSCLLKESHLRRQRLVKAASGSLMSMKTSSVFVSGLGRSHPVENGFTWHQTLGVPYLPGSSVKGVVRAWAYWCKVNCENVIRIFGPRDENDNKHVGSVIFLDAIPTATVLLKPEILTPHYGPWYQNSNTPPGDWHDPIPISFLAVKEGQLFDFGVMPANPSAEQDKEDCKTVCEWLIQALEDSGAGAKTSNGFGRFDKLPENFFAENEEVWPNAMLSWDKGKSTLTATFGPCKSTKQLQGDRSAIPSEIHAQLFVKNKLTPAKVTVSRQGNLIQIVKVEAK